MICGMAGILDSARFRYFLSEELNLSNIQTMVLGGHGDTMVPLIDFTSIEVLKHLINKGLPPKQNRCNYSENQKWRREIVSLMKIAQLFSPACSAIEMLEAYLYDQKNPSLFCLFKW